MTRESRARITARSHTRCSPPGYLSSGRQGTRSTVRDGLLTADTVALARAASGADGRLRIGRLAPGCLTFLDETSGRRPPLSHT